MVKNYFFFKKIIFKKKIIVNINFFYKQKKLIKHILLSYFLFNFNFFKKIKIKNLKKFNYFFLLWDSIFNAKKIVNRFLNLKKKKIFIKKRIFSNIKFLKKKNIYFNNKIKDKFIKKFLIQIQNKKLYYNNKTKNSNNLTNYIFNFLKLNYFQNQRLLKFLLNNNINTWKLFLIDFNFFFFKTIFNKLNIYFFTNFEKKKQNNILKYYIKYQYFSIFWFFNKYFLYYINNIFNINIYIILSKNKKINKIYLINYLNKNIKIPLIFLKIFKKNLINFIDIIHIMFLNKDCLFFIQWLKNIINMINFKKHVLIINTLFKLIYFSFLYLSNSINILGFKIIFKGKIGLIGNVKKRKYILNIGKFNINNIFTKIEEKRDNIQTITGTIGLNICLFYK